MFGNVVIYAKTAEGASVGCTRSAEHDRGASPSFIILDAYDSHTPASSLTDMVV
jgi:hypothetical protein